MKKFWNFNGCQLVVGYAYLDKPASDVEFDEKGKFIRALGYVPAIIEEIRKYLNFSIDVSPFDSRSDEYLNTSVEVDIHVVRNIMRRNFHFESYKFLTRPFFEQKTFVVVSQSGIYSQFEKMYIRPIDEMFEKNFTLLSHPHDVFFYGDMDFYAR